MKTDCPLHREGRTASPKSIRRASLETAFRTSGASRPSSARRLVRLALAALLLAGPALPVASGHAADGRADAPIQSLDQQVQEIKGEVLAIAAELDNLEERLLYPSDTQVAIFVALDADLALDSARVSIDGEPVSHHVYTYKEVEALGKGGVQRIYTGNVATGEHRIEVELRGQRDGGKDFEVLQSDTFHKAKEPHRVGITLRDRLAESPSVAIESW